jgi:hypothetical protein
VSSTVAGGSGWTAACTAPLLHRRAAAQGRASPCNSCRSCRTPSSPSLPRLLTRSVARPTSREKNPRGMKKGSPVTGTIGGGSLVHRQVVGHVRAPAVIDQLSGGGSLHTCEAAASASAPAADQYVQIKRVATARQMHAAQLLELCIAENSSSHRPRTRPQTACSSNAFLTLFRWYRARADCTACLCRSLTGWTLHDATTLSDRTH